MSWRKKEVTENAVDVGDNTFQENQNITPANMV